MAGLQAEGEAASDMDAEETPEWLSGGEAVEEAAPAEAADLPDWMAGLQAEGEVAPDMGAEETPEWLSGGEAVEETAPAEAADLPDWMASLQGESETDDASFGADLFTAEAGLQESEPEVPIETGDTPGWLSSIGAAGSDDESPALESADDAPGWLDSIPGLDDISADDLLPEAEEEAMPADFAPSPAFVDDAGVQDDGDAVLGIEMPDWLSSMAPEDINLGGEEEVDALPAGDAGLSGADLPSWVQAMRPVETVVSDAGDGQEQVVASSGPLAGLSGVLPVGTLGPTQKPQANSIKLRVNESQQSGAALLERILASEAEAAPVRKEDALASIPLLRWIVAALMIFVVVAALLSPQQMTPSPNIAVPEIGAAVNVVNQLPPAGTALVIFDYEAALAAELQVAATPLMDHLMLRGQKLVFLSSTPNGPALAEHFSLDAQIKHQYQRGEDYLNIGYLPGGASGMLSFISDPRSAVAGQLNEASFWDYAPLANIFQISNFSTIVIVTDDVEKGRAWIEQVSANPNAASIPLLMVASAQAEPIIYPYYASAQVDGLVSGLNGGATYERLQGQNGLGREYWDAYSVGLLVAEILIVVGALLNFVAGLRTRQKPLQPQEEE